MEHGILILMPTYKVNAEVLNAAINGFEAQKVRIDAQIAEIRQILAGGPKPTTPEPATSPKPAKRKRRKLSAAGRAAIVAALKKRWAAKKAKAAKSKPEKAAPRQATVKKVVGKKAAVKKRGKVPAQTVVAKATAQ